MTPSTGDPLGRPDHGRTGADYGPMAEFYELVAERQAAVSGPLVTEALAGLGDIDPAEGPIVEIGAGTGAITEVIADAVPDAAIVAAEPSAGMRAVIRSRLVDRPVLLPRVTVTNGAAPDLDLPDHLTAAVILGVAGHLDPEARIRLWSRLRARLAEGGVIVVELMGTRSARPLPPSRQLRATIGSHSYEWWVAGEPAGPETMRFTTRWLVGGADGTRRREVVSSHIWHHVDPGGLATESGMAVRPLGPPTGSGLPVAVVLTHPEEAP